jgi:AcrR family transcriptional regulator
VTDARVLKTREGLRQALLDALQSKPLDQLTVRDLARRAGVGYTTYFRHYPTKEALLDDLAADEIDRLNALTLPVYDADNSRAACVTLCAYIDEHRPLWTALLTGGAAETIRQQLLRRARETSVGRTRGAHALPLELSSALAISAMVELLAWWLRQDHPPPIHWVAEILDQVAIAPVMIMMSEAIDDAERF